MSEYQTTEQKVSYGVGRQLGEQVASSPIPNIDVSAVVAGVKDALEGSASAVPAEELNEAFKEINELLQAEQEKQAELLSVKGEAFLAENAKRDEVTVTESGLQYEVINKGDGNIPTANCTVKTHYHGTLVDGTVFDSSVDRGEPIEFPVNGVIAGWTEALQMMPVGSKWKLYIPHHLAYGAQGAGGAIAPFSALVFEVELLDIAA